MRIEQLENKKCFITGAASGIGRATAMACAKQGAVLFLTDVNGPQLQQVVTEIRTAG